MSSLERMCLTWGLKPAWSDPVRAERAGFALAPLGRREVDGSVRVVDGFWGIEGWTPSIASQWAVRD